ncbi:MAG: DUF1003 domain-containing protein [Steroidobacterales bacterium]
MNHVTEDGNDKVAPSTRENIVAVAGFSNQEAARISRWQNAIERISAFCGSAAYFGAVISFIVLWAGANAWAARRGWYVPDAPPFPWLQGMVSSNALLLTIAVLIRQNRMVRLAEHHAHLDLQINILTEQKVSKVLQMVDELRRELPALRGRPNAEVTALTTPADTGAILEAVKEHLRSGPG